MLSKNDLKFYSSLLLKKFRQEHKKFLVEGEKLILEALDSKFKCEIAFVTNKFKEENKNIIKLLNQGIRLEVLKTNEFKKLCDTKTPQGITAVFHFKQIDTNQIDDNFIVALENISDPGNLGTILRNCDWFGVKSILLSSDSSEIFSPKVIRASAGSVFHLDVFESNDFYYDLEKFKKNGFKILCADINGESIYHFKKPGKMVLILANEANGPTQKIIELTDNKITIPRKGKAESLNVANASAVILSELAK